MSYTCRYVCLRLISSTLVELAHNNNAQCVCCLQLRRGSGNSLFDVIKDKIGLDKPITGYDGNQCLTIMKRRGAWIVSMSGHPLFSQIKSKWEALSDVLEWVVLPNASEYLHDIEIGVNQYCDVLTNYWGGGCLGLVNDTTTTGTTSTAPCNLNPDGCGGSGCGHGRGHVRGRGCGHTLLGAGTIADNPNVALGTNTFLSDMTSNGNTIHAKPTVVLDPPAPEALPPPGYLRQIYLFAKDQYKSNSTPHSGDRGFSARYKAAQVQFPPIEYLWKVYDHMFACHIIPQIKMYGNLISGSSWFVEAGNSAWKSCFKTFTSKGGGRSRSTLSRSVISQALKRMCIRTHHGVKQHSFHARDIIQRQCAKCGQLMKGHVCPFAGPNMDT
jgi:hypothetical protein